MIGTPGCPDNCGCTFADGALTILRAALSLARGVLRSR